jgi:hypothetical protein
MGWPSDSQVAELTSARVASRTRYAHHLLSSSSQHCAAPCSWLSAWPRRRRGALRSNSTSACSHLLPWPANWLCDYSLRKRIETEFLCPSFFQPTPGLSGHTCLSRCASQSLPEPFLMLPPSALPSPFLCSPRLSKSILFPDRPKNRWVGRDPPLHIAHNTHKTHTNCRPRESSEARDGGGGGGGGFIRIQRYYRGTQGACG